MTEGETADVLKGTTLDVYRFMLTIKEPLGVREIQRALNLSSPSVAQYHLSKLEQAGLLKRDGVNYTINKVKLENCIKISSFIVPRYLFYSIFALIILFIGFIFLKPTVLNREYFFFMSATFVFVLIFCYETIKVRIKGSL